MQRPWLGITDLNGNLSKENWLGAGSAPMVPGTCSGSFCFSKNWQHPHQLLSSKAVIGSFDLSLTASEAVLSCGDVAVTAADRQTRCLLLYIRPRCLLGRQWKYNMSHIYATTPAHGARGLFFVVTVVVEGTRKDAAWWGSNHITHDSGNTILLTQQSGVNWAQDGCCPIIFSNISNYYFVTQKTCTSERKRSVFTHKPSAFKWVLKYASHCRQVNVYPAALNACHVNRLQSGVKMAHWLCSTRR